MSLKDLLKKSQQAGILAKSSKAKDTLSVPTRRPTPVNCITDYAGPSKREIERVEAAVRDLPETPQMIEYLAFLYYSSKRYYEASQLYERLLAEGHEPGKQHFHLGNCRYKQGLVDEARKHWKLCLSLCPEERIDRRVRMRLTELDGAA